MIQKSPGLIAAEARARDYAIRNRLVMITPEHLFLALLADPDIEDVMGNLSVDIDHFKVDLAKYLEGRDQNFKQMDQKEPHENIDYSHLFQRAEKKGELLSTRDIFKSYFLSTAIIKDAKGWESYIVSLMRDHDVKPEDVLNLLDHGQVLKKTPAGSAKNNSNGTDFLALYTVNLNKMAAMGKIDPCYGRDDEIKKVLAILRRRSKPNPVLIGEAGVGKTSIAEGLAHLVINGEVPDHFEKAIFYSLDLTALVAGTTYRGDFESRLKGLIEQLEEKEDAYLFIDEIHQLVGGGSASGSMDAANILKPALARGTISVIGGTTLKEYNRYFKDDEALARRFQKVMVPEPTPEKAIAMIGKKAALLGEHFDDVRIEDSAIHAAVNLTHRYIRDRFLPDKALSVLEDVLAENANLPRRSQKTAIGSGDIIAKLETDLRIKITGVEGDEISVLRGLNRKLKQKIFGQDAALDTLTAAHANSRVGFSADDKDKPLGVFLFDGPSGIGKTMAAKILGEDLGLKLVRIDMSEFQEKHQVSRLIGAPPGYVGYHEGSLLQKTFEKDPQCILLLDEMEKAHSDTHNIFLQAFDHGQAKDGQGNVIDFRNCLIIMTTNAGTNHAVKNNSIGFMQPDSGKAPVTHLQSAANSNEEEILSLGADDLRQIDASRIDDTIKPGLRACFSPEFLGRVDVVQFHALNQNHMVNIVRAHIDIIAAQARAKDITLTYSAPVLDYLARACLSPTRGARPMKTFMNTHIVTPLTNAFIDAKIGPGSQAHLKLVRDQGQLRLSFDFNKTAKTPTPDDAPQDKKTHAVPALLRG